MRLWFAVGRVHTRLAKLCRSCMEASRLDARLLDIQLPTVLIEAGVVARSPFGARRIAPNDGLHLLVVADAGNELTLEEIDRWLAER